MVVHYFLNTYCVPIIYMACVLKILSQLWEGSCVIFLKIRTENARVSATCPRSHHFKYFLLVDTRMLLPDSKLNQLGNTRLIYVIIISFL